MLAGKANWEFLSDKEDSSSINLKNMDISPITKELLIQRGITSNEDITNFLSPQLEHLHEPHNLSMIKKATTRVHKAITNKEKILIFGDYDADGVTSTTLLLKTLQELGAKCDFYIPNRFTEGYGPNEQAFRRADEEGFSIIITVDTGIASVEEAIVAKQLGIDLIITDHHEIQEELPDAFAIINPKCSTSYPFAELAGVGVAFKFAQCLLGYFPEHLLDLVAVGTIADLVPLIDENRVLTYFGLRELTLTKNVGLRALKKICKIEGNVTEENVGFSIGPRLNAVGRLEDAELAVELLMSEDEQDAERIAEKIQEINEARQQLVNKIIVEAEQMIECKENERNVIIVAKEDWNEGVLGIVASRLVNKYDRPVIVLAIKNETGEMKGSARSIPAFNLFKNCMQIKELFTQFGGHSQAAGMTFPKENLSLIQNKLKELIKDQLAIEDFSKVIEINKELAISYINEKLINEINLLAPFGMGNNKPIFHIKGVPFEVRQIGHMNKHLKLQFKQDNTLLEGIGFNMGDLYKFMTPHTTISIVGKLNINEWNGVKKAQVIIEDIKIDEPQLFDHRGKKDVNILPYVKNHEHNLVLSKAGLGESDPLWEHVEQINYNTDVSMMKEVDTLYIFDLPPDLLSLKRIITTTNPNNIHVCYYVKESTYLSSFPSRDSFKWFYSLILNRSRLDLKTELNNIMRAKQWTKERIIFMSKVFAELDFIEINDGVIQAMPAPRKRDLKESTLYQQQLDKAEIEKVLYYSNYEKLKSWFESNISRLDTTEEEISYGL